MSIKRRRRSARRRPRPPRDQWLVNTSNVTVHFTCADVGAIQDGIPTGACPADQVLSTEGAAVSSTAQTVTDAAGNTSAPSNVVTVKIDKTPPVITCTASPNHSETSRTTSWSTSRSLSK